MLFVPDMTALCGWTFPVVARIKFRALELAGGHRPCFSCSWIDSTEAVFAVCARRCCPAAASAVGAALCSARASHCMQLGRFASQDRLLLGAAALCGVYLWEDEC
jgi:hypothetical protein